MVSLAAHIPGLVNEGAAVFTLWMALNLCVLLATSVSNIDALRSASTKLHRQWRKCICFKEAHKHTTRAQVNERCPEMFSVWFGLCTVKLWGGDA